MSDKKKQEQEASAIDQLNDNLTNAGRKLADNKKIIFWVVGIILLAGVFTLSYLFIYRNPRLQKSFEAYDKVEQTAMGNDTIAAKEYAAVADAHHGTDAGELAALSAAESFYNIGKYQDAIKYLKDFKSGDEVLNANAKVLMGDCYVNLKKYGEALSAFDDAIKAAKKNPQIVPRVLLKKANIYDEQKKYGDALKCYEQIKSEYPQFTPGNTDINAYIERENARLGK